MEQEHVSVSTSRKIRNNLAWLSNSVSGIWIGMEGKQTKPHNLVNDLLKFAQFIIQANVICVSSTEATLLF